MLDNRVEVFLHVARCLNISQAARDLFMSQPAVTSAIQKLEDHYSIKLFLRLPRGLELTPAGVLLYRHLKELKDGVVDLENEMMKIRGTLHGKILIGASPTFGNYTLPHLLGLFSQLYPEISYRLTIANNSQVYAFLQEGKIELAFLVGTLPGKRLDAKKIMEDELVMIAAPGHPWASGVPVKSSELLTQPVILREKGSGSRKDMEEAYAEMGLPPDELIVIAELNSLEAIKQAVIANLGTALVSRRAAEKEIEQGLLKTVGIEGVKLARNIYAATLPDARLTAAASDLLQFVNKELNEKPCS